MAAPDPSYLYKVYVDRDAHHVVLVRGPRVHYAAMTARDVLVEQGVRFTTLHVVVLREPAGGSGHVYEPGGTPYAYRYVPTTGALDTDYTGDWRPDGAVAVIDDVPGHDHKYGRVTAERKNFHPGEPVFLLRAADREAPAQVLDYANRCHRAGCPEDHVYGVRAAVTAMLNWQDANRALVKTPD